MATTVDGLPKSAVYVGVGAVALLVAYVLHKRTDSTSAVAVPASTEAAVSGTLPEPTTASTGASAGGAGSGTSSLSNDTQWSAQALALLTAQGVSPGNAQGLLFNYLKGADLNTGINVPNAADLIAAVLNALGAPPVTSLSDADIYQAVYGYVPTGVSTTTGSAATASASVTGTDGATGASSGAVGTQLVSSGGVAGGVLGTTVTSRPQPIGAAGGVTGVGR